ncbi:uncharacterized protein F5891DRAFT_977865 [Suillus fuscotomentosus]|uniref:Uncharacterized protein n=1 Tax=Suillus fuscotomentosus TaxID=1912939 RepID=A0AAD4EBU4_9AGAM|nr:uncharacterized protein F5891DRAFT_977865 [Suillus fuscotomentosus]KAG1903275.1 hypothetical protein F5891DRAFT_977865 [Suillus fuscotomentosus]
MAFSGARTAKGESIRIGFCISALLDGSSSLRFLICDKHNWSLGGRLTRSSASSRMSPHKRQLPIKCACSGTSPDSPTRKLDLITQRGVFQNQYEMCSHKNANITIGGAGLAGRARSILAVCASLLNQDTHDIVLEVYDNHDRYLPFRLEAQLSWIICCEVPMYTQYILKSLDSTNISNHAVSGRVGCVSKIALHDKVWPISSLPISVADTGRILVALFSESFIHNGHDPTTSSCHISAHRHKSNVPLA